MYLCNAFGPPDWKPGVSSASRLAKRNFLHSPILAGGSGIYTTKALFQKPPTAEIGLFFWHKMRDIKDQVDEILFQLGAKSRYDRMIELITAEKELAKERSMLAAWEIFRQGISDQYPHLLKWCPQNTITVHDPELPGVVIVDSVNV